MMQENKCAIILEKNSNRSFSKRSRNFNTRYFIVDQIKKKNLKVKHYPTDNVDVDFMPKTIQGGFFTNPGINL